MRITGWQFGAERFGLGVLAGARLAYHPTWSLHVAYLSDENTVLKEFAEIGPGLGYDCQGYPQGKF